MVDKKVTAITAQKRNPNRVNVFLDGEYSFSLSRIVAAWLEPGRVLHQDEIDALVNKDTTEVALQSALKLIDYRPRAEREIRQKLSQKGFEPEQIEKVIETLRVPNLIQDEKFAASWVESRNEFHPRSHRLMRYELLAKGIENEQIEEALKSSAGDRELAQKAANKMVKRLSNLDWLEFRKKLTAHLMRRGFSFEVINPIARSAWEKLQSETTILENEEIGK